MILSVFCNCFNTTKKSFYVNMTMNQTWIHHFTPESNWQSAEWTAAGESRPKWAKTQTSAGKVLASVFWSMQGISFVHWLPWERKNHQEWISYSITGVFEGRNRQKKKKKEGPNEEEKVLFHQDNAPCHKSIKTMVKLHELNFELLPHPHYSPDMATINYWLFIDFKRMLQGKRFGSNE